MRITIIPSDGFVSVDGIGYSGLDLSAIDSSVHAVQWYGENGEVEVRDLLTRKMVENRNIISITEFQPALTAWQTAKDVAVAAEEASRIAAEQNLTQEETSLP